MRAILKCCTPRLVPGRNGFVVGRSARRSCHVRVSRESVAEWHTPAVRTVAFADEGVGMSDSMAARFQLLDGTRAAVGCPVVRAASGSQRGCAYTLGGCRGPGCGLHDGDCRPVLHYVLGRPRCYRCQGRGGAPWGPVSREPWVPGAEPRQAVRTAATAAVASLCRGRDSSDVVYVAPCMVARMGCVPCLTRIWRPSPVSRADVVVVDSPDVRCKLLGID